MDDNPKHYKHAQMGYVEKPNLSVDEFVYSWAMSRTVSKGSYVIMSAGL